MDKAMFGAVSLVTTAMDEVKALGGKLPEGDDETPPVETFLELVKQYSAGTSVPESAVVAVIDALQPLFPGLTFKWK